MNIVDDFWIDKDRWVVIHNSDTKGYELYLAKIIEVVRIDES